MPAKILTLDIETSPANGWFWGLWDQNIGLNQLAQESFILCWAAKWLGQPKVYYEGLEGLGKIGPDDEKRILQGMWNMMDEADIIITHNGDGFDIKHLNTAFHKAGMGPPSPFRSIDTLKTVKARFKFMSNKLAYLVKILGIQHKMENEGFELWLKCLRGQAAAWNTMKKYNKQDVVILEELYLNIRGWIKNHPNVALYEDGEEAVCGNCGGTSFRNKGYYYTNLSKFTSHVCNDCGTWKRGRKNLANRDNLLVNAL